MTLLKNRYNLQFAKIDHFSIALLCCLHVQVCALYSIRNAQIGLCNIGLQQKYRMLEMSHVMSFLCGYIVLILYLYITEVICIHCNCKQCGQSDVVIGFDSFVVFWFDSLLFHLEPTFI